MPIKFLLLGGGGRDFFEKGGGGSANFIFMGVGIFRHKFVFGQFFLAQLCVRLELADT